MIMFIYGTIYYIIYRKRDALRFLPFPQQPKKKKNLMEDLNVEHNLILINIYYNKDM